MTFLFHFFFNKYIEMNPFLNTIYISILLDIIKK